MKIQTARDRHGMTRDREAPSILFQTQAHSHQLAEDSVIPVRGGGDQRRVVSMMHLTCSRTREEFYWPISS